MTDVQSLGARYCPACGAEVAAAQAIAGADVDLIGQGEFERAGAHLVVESSEIRIYQHSESDDG